MKVSLLRCKYPSGWFVVWLVVLFDGVSTLFVSFNAELSHFDKSFKQFSLVKA